MLKICLRQLGSCKAFLCISCTFHTTFLYAPNPRLTVFQPFLVLLCAHIRFHMPDGGHQTLTRTTPEVITSIWNWIILCDNELCLNDVLTKRLAWRSGRWGISERNIGQDLCWSDWQSRSASHWLVELGDRSILAGAAPPQNAFFGRLVSPLDTWVATRVRGANHSIKSKYEKKYKSKQRTN